MGIDPQRSVRHERVVGDAMGQEEVVRVGHGLHGAGDLLESAYQLLSAALGPGTLSWLYPVADGQLGLDDAEADQSPVAPEPDLQHLLDSIIERMAGVVSSQGAKYVMLNAPRAALDEITAILPGAGSPTVMPLSGRDDAVAVHAVCQEAVFWETLEKLKAAGASAILVLPIEKMM